MACWRGERSHAFFKEGIVTRSTIHYSHRLLFAFSVRKWRPFFLCNRVYKRSVVCGGVERLASRCHGGCVLPQGLARPRADAVSVSWSAPRWQYTRSTPSPDRVLMCVMTSGYACRCACSLCCGLAVVMCSVVSFINNPLRGWCRSRVRLRKGRVCAGECGIEYAYSGHRYKRALSCLRGVPRKACSPSGYGHSCDACRVGRYP